MIQVNAEADAAKTMKAKAEEQTKQISSVAVMYDQTRNQIYNDLLATFKTDLPRWRAQLDRDLAIRFEEPSVLFDSGKAELKPEFRKILDEFFPRYVRVISKYKEAIEEVRIEGHTSRVWNAQTNNEEAYFKNMELSQSRTRTTLAYLLTMGSVANEKDWLVGKLTANGLSSSKPRLNVDGSENLLASQRVEFRVRTNADARISQILNAAVK